MYELSKVDDLILPGLEERYAKYVVRSAVKNYTGSFLYNRWQKCGLRRCIYYLKPLRRKRMWSDNMAVSGVYFVFADAMLLYIGQSANIKKRLIQHSYAHLFYEYSKLYDTGITIFYWTISEEFRREWEVLMIGLVRPLLNIADRGDFIFYEMVEVKRNDAMLGMRDPRGDK